MRVTEKFVPNVIKVKGARLAFARIHKPQARTNKKGQPIGEPKYSCTLLLDPSNTEHAASIKEIKAEAKRALDHRFGEGKWPKNLILCFGNGNDLEKVYDGFRDMWYIKLADKNRPELRNRAAQPVVEGDPQCPYAGCYVNGTMTLWSYDNESRGVSANLRGLQFVKDGQAFGGGADRSNDFDPMETSTEEGGNAPDPFDE